LTLTDALFNLQSDGTVYFAPGVTVSGATASGQMIDLGQPIFVSIDLTSLAADTVATLYFDLLGFGELGSRVTIDDVRIVTDGAVNTAPVAENDEVEVEEDGSVMFDARANDNDAEGDSLTVVLGTVLRTRWS
jgi:hypothetical protein